MNTHRAVSVGAVFIAAAALGLGAGKVALQAAQQVFVTNTLSTPVPTTMVNNPSVTILDSASAPLFVKDVDNLGRNGRQVFLTLNFAAGGTTVTTNVVVPTGYRFVVRQVSAQSLATNANDFATGVFVTAENAQNFVHANWSGLFAQEIGNTKASILTNQETYFFGESADTMIVAVRRSSAVSTTAVNVTLSGYLVKMT
jgi:hypothetical protein